ncbi:MAG: hypothetical protein ACQETH_14565 [Candidatus Rifleibacteriota bacterium]
MNRRTGGEKIAFQRGMPQKLVFPEDKLYMTGKAYFGEHLEPGQINNTESHDLWKQIKRLNLFRKKIPALTFGAMEKANWCLL